MYVMYDPKTAAIINADPQMKQLGVTAGNWLVKLAPHLTVYACSTASDAWDAMRRHRGDSF